MFSGESASSVDGSVWRIRVAGQLRPNNLNPSIGSTPDGPDSGPEPDASGRGGAHAQASTAGSAHPRRYPVGAATQRASARGTQIPAGLRVRGLGARRYD